MVASLELKKSSPPENSDMQMFLDTITAFEKSNLKFLYKLVIMFRNESNRSSSVICPFCPLGPRKYKRLSRIQKNKYLGK